MVLLLFALVSQEPESQTGPEDNFMLRLSTSPFFVVDVLRLAALSGGQMVG